MTDQLRHKNTVELGVFWHLSKLDNIKNVNQSFEVTLKAHFSWVPSVTF